MTKIAAGFAVDARTDAAETDYEYVWEEIADPVPAHAPYRFSSGTVSAADVRAALAHPGRAYQALVNRLDDEGLGCVAAADRVRVLLTLAENEYSQGPDLRTDARPHRVVLKHLRSLPNREAVQVAAKMCLALARTAPTYGPFEDVRAFVHRHYPREFGRFIALMKKDMANPTGLKLWRALTFSFGANATHSGLIARIPVFVMMIATWPVVAALRLIPAFDAWVTPFMRDARPAMTERLLLATRPAGTELSAALG